MNYTKMVKNLRCDAYEEGRNNLIEAKGSPAREYLRMRFVIARAGLTERQSEMEHIARLAATSPMGWQIEDSTTADPFPVDIAECMRAEYEERQESRGTYECDASI